MSAEFERLDLDGVRASLERLFDQVSRGKSRVEVTRQSESCVLISKSELESLERALEILSDTDACRDMRRLVQEVAAQAEPPATALLTAS